MMNSIMSYIYTLVFFSIFIAILEMILPKGNNKKYVTLVSGLLLTYITISPIISILSGMSETKNNITHDIEAFNSQYVSTRKNIEQDTYILNLFEKGIENDIKNRLKQYGYAVDNIEIEYTLNDNNEITQINDIRFSVVSKLNNEEENKMIEKVDINISVNETSNDLSNIELSSEEVDKIKECICQAYMINKDNVHIG